jgi:pimeloyl-ACP methyl ester carboxylesterase
VLEVVGYFNAQDGTRLAYRMFGGGPRVVTCLHSLALDGSWFAPLVKAVGDRYSWLCPDFLGHGESETVPVSVSLERVAADVVTLWDRLGIDQGAVVGVSLGGMVAQALLASVPARIDGLVLMATTNTYGEEARAAAMARATLAREPGGLSQLAGLTLERWFGDAAADRDNAMVAQARQQFLAGDSEVHARYLEAMTMVGSLPRPAEVPPTLVLGGDDDRSTPPPVIEALAASVPGAQLRFTAGGHLAAFQSPGAVAPELAAFLRQTASMS